MAVVVDASVVIALAAREPAADLVGRLVHRWSQARERMHAPHLMSFEVASAFTKMVRRGFMDSGDVRAAWQLVTALDIQFHLQDDVPSIVEVALRLQRQSAYDAAYLTLAGTLHAELWTLDGALARNASGLGFSVRLIEP